MHAGMTIQEMLTEVVRQSEAKDDYEAAHEFEELGNKILTLSPRAWDRIALAA